MGCPPKVLMFLVGTRFEPERAGIKATDLGVMDSDEAVACQEGDDLEFGVNVQGFDARLARTVTR